MTKDITLKEELALRLDTIFHKFLSLLEDFAPSDINTVPFEGSWTAAQVADHVCKSNHSITRALQLRGTIINRNPFQRVQELKEIFLDFNTKLQSPDFILPDKTRYDKVALMRKTSGSIYKLIEAAQKIELLEMIDHPAFGDITKFEILHFVEYHTKRHIHQLEKIYERIVSANAGQ